MKTMKTTLLAAVGAVVALGSAGVASAQPAYGRYDDHGRHERYDRDDRYEGRARYQDVRQLDRRLDRVRWQIDRATQNGRLDRGERQRLIWAAERTGDRLDRYRQGGFNPAELADLDRRIDRLETQLRIDRRDPAYAWDQRNWR